MGRKPTGVYARKGLLSELLFELGLTRAELAERVELSTRTLYNIDYGRKRILRSHLERIAAELNRRSAEGNSVSLDFQVSADLFVASSGDAIANCFVSTIHEADGRKLFFGDNPIAGESIHYSCPGAELGIPYGGEFDGLGVLKFYELRSPCVRVVKLPSTTLFRDLRNSRITLRSETLLEHPDTLNRYIMRAYTELDVRGGKLHKSASIFDSYELAEFLKNGIAP